MRGLRVLDASALLALINQEAGWESVADSLPDAAMSAVNWSEVARKALEVGHEAGALRGQITDLGLEIVSFGADDADATARIWPLTRHAGLSLGDRACLALAQRLGAAAVTADRAWERVAPALGVDVELIR